MTNRSKLVVLCTLFFQLGVISPSLFGFYGHNGYCDKLVEALEVNQTIDDAAAGDADANITFLGNWAIGQGCGGCHVRPDPGQAFNGSWHDVTADTQRVTGQQVIVNFIGTAVYLYCIMANTVNGAGTNSKFSFVLDGGPSGPNFNHAPSPSTDYIYNVLIYSKTGLTNTSHTVVVNLDGGAGVDGSSLMLFDYARYTQFFADSPQLPKSAVSTVSTPNGTAPIPSKSTTTPSGDDPNTTPSTTLSSDIGPTSTASGIPTPGRISLGALIGAVVGGVLIFSLIIAILLYFYCKRKRNISGRKLLPSIHLHPRHHIVPWYGSSRHPPATPYPPTIISSGLPSSSGTTTKRGAFTETTSASQELQGRIDVLEDMINHLTSNRDPLLNDPRVDRILSFQTPLSTDPIRFSVQSKVLRQNAILQDELRVLREEMESIRELHRLHHLRRVASMGRSEPEALPEYQPRESTQ